MEYFTMTFGPMIELERQRKTTNLNRNPNGMEYFQYDLGPHVAKYHATVFME
jgi:hypothetical protein